MEHRRARDEPEGLKAGLWEVETQVLRTKPRGQRERRKKLYRAERDKLSRGRRGGETFTGASEAAHGGH